MKRRISINGDYVIWHEEDIKAEKTELIVDEGIDVYLYKNGARVEKITGDGVVTIINGGLFKKSVYEVYCVNVNKFLRVNFGTNAPVQFIDEELKFQLQARARGYVNISITDPVMLLTELRQRKIITNDEIIEKIQPIIINQCTKKLHEISQGSTKSQLISMSDKLGAKIMKDSSFEINQTYGVYFANVVIECITVTGDEEYRQNQSDNVLLKQRVEGEKSINEINKLRADSVKDAINAVNTGKEKPKETPKKEETKVIKEKQVLLMCPNCKKTYDIDSNIIYCPICGRQIR